MYCIFFHIWNRRCCPWFLSAKAFSCLLTLMDSLHYHIFSTCYIPTDRFPLESPFNICWPWLLFSPSSILNRISNSRRLLIEFSALGDSRPAHRFQPEIERVPIFHVIRQFIFVPLRPFHISLCSCLSTPSSKENHRLQRTGGPRSFKLFGIFPPVAFKSPPSVYAQQYIRDSIFLFFFPTPFFLLFTLRGRRTAPQLITALWKSRNDLLIGSLRSVLAASDARDAGLYSLVAAAAALH